MSRNVPGWEQVRLNDVLDFREGPGIMARDFREHGVPLLRLAGLKRGAGLLDGCNYLDEEMVRNRWNHFRVELGDVLLSTSASLGEVAVVDEPTVGAVPYTGIIRFRPMSDRIIPEFVQFALTAPTFKRQVEEMGVGSVMRHFGPTHLVQMTINLPSIPAQEAIASVLGALDGKIAVNDRIAEIGEALALALGSHEQWAATVPLAGIVDHIKNQVLPERLAVDCVAHYSIPAFDSMHLPELVPPRSIKSGKFRVDAPSVLVSKLNPSIPRVWNVDPSPQMPALASTEFLVLRPRPGISTDELWTICSQPGFTASLAARVTGTSNSHQRVKPHDLLATEVVDPREMPGDVRDSVSVVARRVHEARIESLSLLELRDTLLPRLMSGEIRVREAERIVEDVT